jgi:hypothetical protein
VWIGWYKPTFRRRLLSPSSGFKTEISASSKRWLLPTNPRGRLTQKNDIRIATAVKILNLTFQLNVINPSVIRSLKWYYLCIISDHKRVCSVMRERARNPSTHQGLQNFRWPVSSDIQLSMYNLNPCVWLEMCATVASKGSMTSRCAHQLSCRRSQFPTTQLHKLDKDGHSANKTQWKANLPYERQGI